MNGIILSEEKLAYLFDEIARGFKKSPLEIALFFVLVLVIAAIPVFITRRQTERRRRRNALLSRRLFKETVTTRGFSTEELDLLSRLSSVLNDPSRIHLLVRDRAVFNRCVRKLGPADTDLSVLSAIRTKLGFRARSGECRPRSTGGLPTGLPLSFGQSDDQTGRTREWTGLIREILPESFLVETAGHPVPPKRGDVLVTFDNAAGSYTFRTRVRNHGRGVVYLDHTDGIQRVQRRAFFRKNLHIPVIVRRTLDGGTAERTRATLIDLGGGGASLKMHDLHMGEKLGLTIPLSHGAIDLQAEVIRLSKNHSVTHVVFRGVEGRDRDTILGYLFRR